MYFQFPNIRHLRIFQEVARLSGINAASKTVHLSQPAITQAILKLEKHFGVKLFLRLSNSMETTEPGAILLRRVERMLAQLVTGGEKILKRSAGKQPNNKNHFIQFVTSTQLRALTALADTENFSIAARNAGVSQPTIHRAGRELEQLTQTRLFKTISHGIELTSAAKHLAKCVGLAAAELQQGYDEIAAYKGQMTTKITVGSMPLARAWVLPQAIHASLKENSRLQIQTIDGPFSELLRGLRHGKIDFLIGALRDPAPAADIVQEVLFNDPLALVVRRGHPLASQTKINIKDTLGFPWVAPPKSTPSGSYLYKFLNIGGLDKTPVKVVSSSLVLVRGLLLAGDYVTIASLRQLRHELENKVLVPLAIELPGSARPIGLTYRAGWQPTNVQQHLLEALRNILHSKIE